VIRKRYVPKTKLWEKILGYSSIHEKHKEVLMEEIKTKIVCPNCCIELTSDGRFDENTDEQIACASCGFVVAKWCYDFVESNAPEEEQ